MYWLVAVFMGLPVLLKICGIGAHPVKMKNAQTGQIKKGLWGFSWTYLFFGFWVPMIRAELGVAALHLLLTIMTGGLWQLIVSFLYNRQYTHRLLERGFRFSDSEFNNNVAAARVGVELV